MARKELDKIIHKVFEQFPELKEDWEKMRTPQKEMSFIQRLFCDEKREEQLKNIELYTFCLGWLTAKKRSMEEQLEAKPKKHPKSRINPKKEGVKNIKPRFKVN